MACCTWYERVLGASRIARLDHRDGAGRLFAAVLDVPGLGTLLQLRSDIDTGTDVRGFPPSPDGTLLRFQTRPDLGLG